MDNSKGQLQYERDVLIGLAYDDFDANKFEIVSEEIVDQRRWVTVYEQIIHDKEANVFFSTNYDKGSTECQDTRPYEFDDEMVDVIQVVPVEVTKIEYQAVSHK